MASETWFIIGESRTHLDNAITKMFGSFYIALEVEADTGKILDVGCTHSLDLTERFIRELLLGYSLATDLPLMEREVVRRYHGSSNKAVLASLKEAQKKYLQVRERLKTE